MKTALYIIVPLVIILILYFVFFGLKKPTSASNSRINEIDNALKTDQLTYNEVQDLTTEKIVLQG